MGRKRAIEIVEEIYAALYADATPPLNYRDLLESPDEVKRLFDYNDHCLSQSRFDSIVDKHLNKSRLSDYWKKSIRIEVYLVHGPSSSKKEAT